MRNRLALLSLPLVVSMAMTGACRKPPVVSTPPAEPARVEPAKPAPPPEPKKEVTEGFPTMPVEQQPVVESSVDDLNRQGVLKTVYFTYDSHDLDDAARSTLQANADWLEANRSRRIRVEGHCDERGTVEYNLALGERRASGVRDYLAGLGIDASRIRIVSYGEENPSDPRHNEAAWVRNRRAEFVIES